MLHSGKKKLKQLPRKQIIKVEEIKVKKLKVKKNSMKVQQKMNHKKRRCTAAKRKEKSLF
jgi:hypothetical protein